MTLDYLKQNSIKILKEDIANGSSGLEPLLHTLVEGTDTIDIAQTDEIISTVIEKKQYTSLAYQICEVSPIHGPTGATFALVYDQGKVKLLRNEVQVEDDAIEDTGFTIEAMQDLKTQFGKEMIDYISRAFSGVSSMNENRKLIQKLSTFAQPAADLVLTDPKNAETSIFEIQQKVAELVLTINSSSFKSLDSFVILPLKAAAAMLAVSNRLPDNKKESGLYLGSNSRTKFYLNPDVASTEVFVGIKSDIPGMSSVIMSPYFHTIKAVKDPKTGNSNLFNFNRYAITESKLSEYEKMLFKFEIPNAASIPNNPPIANAGGDQTVATNMSVALDGSASIDPEGNTLTYQWTLLNSPTGSVADIQSKTLETASLTPDVPGQYRVQLVVFDGVNYSPADTALITAI